MQRCSAFGRVGRHGGLSEQRCDGLCHQTQQKYMKHYCDVRVPRCILHVAYVRAICHEGFAQRERDSKFSQNTTKCPHESDLERLRFPTGQPDLEHT